MASGSLLGVCYRSIFFQEAAYSSFSSPYVISAAVRGSVCRCGVTCLLTYPLSTSPIIAFVERLYAFGFLQTAEACGIPRCKRLLFILFAAIIHRRAARGRKQKDERKDLSDFLPSRSAAWQSCWLLCLT